MGLYSPLPPRTIRLLRLIGSTNPSATRSLESFDLEDAPRYHAISHSWADEGAQTTLSLGSHNVSIGTSLISLLERLEELSAEAGRFPQVEYIWIDKICIDQNNLAERSAQVAIMGEIYRESVRTLIWLGCDMDDSHVHSAWELVDEVYNAFQSENPTAEEARDISVRMFSESLHDSTKLPPWTDPKWKHLEQLMAVKWFSRIWVVQEVALSRLDPIILHGKEVFAWSKLGWAAAWLRRSGYMRLPQIPETLRNVYCMTNLRQASAFWPIEALLSITQVKFTATDQRDKVYGIMGLAAECQDAAHLPKDLVADYTMDVSEIYQKITVYLIKKTGSLALLTRAYGVDGIEASKQAKSGLVLPSWTPDWSAAKAFTQGISTSLSRIEHSDLSKPASLEFPDHFTASATRGVEIEDSQNWGVLRLRGLHADVIDKVFPLTITRRRDEESERNLTTQIGRILKELVSSLDLDDQLAWAEKFIRTSILEQHWVSGRGPEQCLRDGFAYLVELLSNDAALLKCIADRSSSENILDALRDRATGGIREDYDSLVRNYGFDRAFIITKDGRMGVAPSSTRQHDIVSVLYGGGVPYCIRQKENHVLFVGECYVEGLMRAEALTSSGPKDEKTFCFQ